MGFFITTAFMVMVFMSSFATYAAGTRYVQAVHTGRRIPVANWAVIQWIASAAVFVIAVKISLWYLPLEAAGLWCGSYWAAGGQQGNTEPSVEVSQSRKDKPRIGFV